MKESIKNGFMFGFAFYFEYTIAKELNIAIGEIYTQIKHGGE